MSTTRLIPIIALAATLAGSAAAGAQTTTASPAPAASGAPAMGHHHHRHHHQSLAHALRSLNLTDAQKQQVATFASQERQANTNADPATRHANAGKFHDQVMGILTPDQKTQLQAAMRQRHGTNGESRPDSGAPVVPNPAASPASR